MLWIAHNKSSKFIYGKCIAFLLLTDDVFHMETFSLPAFINCELKHRCLSSWNWFSFSHFYISPFNFAWHTFFSFHFPFFIHSFNLPRVAAQLERLMGSRWEGNGNCVLYIYFFGYRANVYWREKWAFFPNWRQFRLERTIDRSWIFLLVFFFQFCSVVRLTDRKYMLDLQKRIQEDYHDTLLKRISKREVRTLFAYWLTIWM